MDKTRIVPVKLANNSLIRIEISDLAGSHDPERAVAGLPNLRFSEIMKSLEGVAEEMGDFLARASPSKAGIEFSIEVGVEAGQLTALLVKGSGKANFKVSMTWENAGSGTRTITSAEPTLSHKTSTG
jgi:hypothetical protein